MEGLTLQQMRWDIAELPHWLALTVNTRALAMPTALLAQYLVPFRQV